MLSSEQIMMVARGLGKIQVDPGTAFAVGFIIAIATVEAPLRHETGVQQPVPARRRRNGRVKRKPEPASPPANGEQRAVHFLRGALSRGPAAASHVERLAARKGIGPADLQVAKSTLGVCVERHDNGVGVVYLLPKHQRQDGAEAKSSGVLL